MLRGDKARYQHLLNAYTVYSDGAGCYAESELIDLPPPRPLAPLPAVGNLLKP